MKRSALKQSALALVPSRSKPTRKSKESSSKVNDYFDGWMQSVGSSALQNKTSQSKREAPSQGNRPLTQSDLSRVMLATVRESSDHRHWPPGVFEKFLVAEVIRPKREN
jgi:hypothetical protein